MAEKDRRNKGDNSQEQGPYFTRGGARISDDGRSLLARMLTPKHTKKSGEPLRRRASAQTDNDGRLITGKSRASGGAPGYEPELRQKQQVPVVDRPSRLRRSLTGTLAVVLYQLFFVEE